MKITNNSHLLPTCMSVSCDSIKVRPHGCGVEQGTTAWKYELNDSGDEVEEQLLGTT